MSTTVRYSDGRVEKWDDNSSASKHTPGPWFVGYGEGVTGGRAAASVYWDETNVCEQVIRKGDAVVCYVASVRKEDDLLPDARLIAAAPDLLEALRECLSCEFAVTDKAAIAKAEAAIAKATQP